MLRKKLQLEDDLQVGKVAQRSLDPNGNTFGTFSDNPLLNTITYDIEFLDGQVKEYSVSIIPENMLKQVDSNGYSLTLMDGIIDHQTDHNKVNPSQMVT